MNAIRRVTLRKCTCELIKKGRYTTGVVDPDLTSVIVEISNGEVSGFGEFVASSMVTHHVNSMAPNTLDEWGAIQAAGAKLLGRDARGLRNLVPAELEVEEANSVVDGIDFALHDLVGKTHGLPVQALLGGVSKPFVWGMPVVHTDEPDAMIARAKFFHDRWRYRYYKLKPIGRFEDDRKVIAGIRALVGPEAHIFIDTNFGLNLDVDGVVAYLNELHRAGLEVCEDPIDADFETYREVQRRTPVRIMIDSKARTLGNVFEIVQARAAQMINVHANWASGFAPAMLKASVAGHAGIDTMIGSTAYLGIGSSAYQVLSSVLRGNAPCEQVLGSTYAKNPVSSEYHTEDGRIYIPDRPGLGITVDSGKLDAVTIEKVVIG